MFDDINDYMTNKDREERRHHLELTECCIEIGGDSRSFRGLLAHHLKTTISSKFYVCHACNNEKCSNPRHLYWGTPKDNHIDQVEAGTWSSPRERTIKKHGLEEANKIQQINSSLGGKKGGGKNKLSDSDILKYKEAIINAGFPKRGWLTKASKELNISHTQIKRVYNKYIADII